MSIFLIAAYLLIGGTVAVVDSRRWAFDQRWWERGLWGLAVTAMWPLVALEWIGKILNREADR